MTTIIHQIGVRIMKVFLQRAKIIPNVGTTVIRCLVYEAEHCNKCLMHYTMK